jgi:hypothetical protein
LDRAKAPGFGDRKGVHIANIEPFAIVESRELSRGSKSKFMTESGITSPDKKGETLSDTVREQGASEDKTFAAKPTLLSPNNSKNREFVKKEDVSILHDTVREQGASEDKTFSAAKQETQQEAHPSKYDTLIRFAAVELEGVTK